TNRREERRSSSCLTGSTMGARKHSPKQSKQPSAPTRSYIPSCFPMKRRTAITEGMEWVRTADTVEDFLHNRNDRTERRFLSNSQSRLAAGFSRYRRRSRSTKSTPTSRKNYAINTAWDTRRRRIYSRAITRFTSPHTTRTRGFRRATVTIRDLQRREAAIDSIGQRFWHL